MIRLDLDLDSLESPRDAMLTTNDSDSIPTPTSPPAYNKGDFAFIAGDTKTSLDFPEPAPPPPLEPYAQPPQEPALAYAALEPSNALIPSISKPSPSKGAWCLFSRRASVKDEEATPSTSDYIQTLDLPFSFTRPPPVCLAYPLDFPPMMHVPTGEYSLDKGFPPLPPASLVVPHPFVTHDINEKDWLTFLEDIRRTSALSNRERGMAMGIPFAMQMGFAAFFVSKYIKRRMRKRKLVDVGQVVDVWNQSFFHPRRLEVVLMHGSERISGVPVVEEDEATKNLATISSDSSDSSSSSSDSDSESESSRDSHRQQRGKKDKKRHATSLPNLAAASSLSPSQTPALSGKALYRQRKRELKERYRTEYHAIREQARHERKETWRAKKEERREKKYSKRAEKREKREIKREVRRKRREEKRRSRAGRGSCQASGFRLLIIPH